MFNKKDFILHKRGAYSQEGCTHAINFFEKRKHLHEEGSFGGYKYDPKQKKCTEMYLKKDNYKCTNKERNFSVYTLFEDLLLGCRKDYIKKYPFVARLAPWNSSPTFKIQKYLPGEGYFVEHCECDGGGSIDEIKRSHAWMIYLNDVTDGGYTVFPNQKRKFRPRRGDVLVWPAYFTHTHHGITSKTQTKYIATGWYNF